MIPMERIVQCLLVICGIFVLLSYFGVIPVDPFWHELLGD